MLRSVIGFDHCPKNVADTWMPVAGVTIQKYPGESAKSVIVNSKGALSTVSGTNATRTIVSMRVSPQPPVPNTGFVLGFRITIDALGSSGPIGYVAGDVAGTSAQTLPTFAQVFPSLVVGSTAYFEMVVDTVNRTTTWYVNGVQTAGGANDNGSFANMALGNIWFFPMLASANSAGIASFRDFYLLDTTAGDGFVSRLGDRVMVPIVADVAAGAEWSTNSSSLDLLGTLVADLLASTSVLKNGYTNKPLTVSLNSAVPAGYSIDAVQLFMSGATDVDSRGNPKVGTSITYNSKTQSGASLTQSGTLTYGQNLGVFPTAPDGTLWSASKIDVTTVNLTADT